MKNRTELVRELNNLARTAMGVAGRLHQTPGIDALANRHAVSDPREGRGVF